MAPFHILNHIIAVSNFKRCKRQTTNDTIQTLRQHNTDLLFRIYTASALGLAHVAVRLRLITITCAAHSNCDELELREQHYLTELKSIYHTLQRCCSHANPQIHLYLIHLMSVQEVLNRNNNSAVKS